MLRSLWKLQWKQFAARMKKGNGKKTSGGVRRACSVVRNGAYVAVFRHGGHNGAGVFHVGQRFYDAGAVV